MIFYTMEIASLVVLGVYFTQISGFNQASPWNKDLLLQKFKGRYLSSFGDDQKRLTTQKRDIFDLAERAYNRKSKRKLGRRRASPKCFITGSTVHCDGGLKIRGAGPIGKPGSPGLPGPKVGKGDKGYRGSPGRPGPDGPVGPRGQRGPKGKKGSQGSKGERGDPGLIGPQGKPGVPSNCNLGLKESYHCTIGVRGPTGIKGSQGAEGNVGEKGDTGFVGAPGDKGSRGSAGVPGSIGLYGDLRLNGSCRELQSKWVVPNLSPIGHLKTECAFREYLLSLSIEADKNNEKIRYKYKCCPFSAADIPSGFL